MFLRAGIGPVLVAELLEHSAEFLLGKQEEQHHRVSLLGELVVIGIIAFSA